MNMCAWIIYAIQKSITAKKKFLLKNSYFNQKRLEKGITNIIIFTYKQATTTYVTVVNIIMGVANYVCTKMYIMYMYVVIENP